VDYANLIEDESDQIEDLLDSTLHRQVQAYLEQRARGVTPSAHLAAAWEQFYSALDPQIRRGVALNRVPMPDRSDCIQEIWLAIVSRLEHFRPDPSRARLRTWVAALVRNISINCIRNRHRHPLEQLDATQTLTIPATESTAAESLERTATQSLVQEALKDRSVRVSPDSFRVLYARWIEGRTIPEIAADLNLSPQQVRARHYRVIRRFHRFAQLLRGCTEKEACHRTLPSDSKRNSRHIHPSSASNTLVSAQVLRGHDDPSSM
jgi:RNA polymerase sigma factor (sigma-70 family)